MAKKTKKSKGTEPKIDPLTVEKAGSETVILDYSIFRVGNEFYAIPLEKVTEILHDFEIEKIAHLSDYYCGAIRYRGATLLVVDLDKVLNHSQPDNSSRTCLLIKGAEGLYAMQVDSDVDIIQVQPEQVYPLPDCYSTEEAGMMHGILVYGDNLYGILNPSRIYNMSKNKEV